jgi:DNA (cytosine-5)-methyltransferase 1
VKPRLLDLFCGAGGAGMGYHRAGFVVAGIDNQPQPNYPFGFMLYDAIEYLYSRVQSGRIDFDAVHASPPCQAFSSLRYLNDKPYPQMVGELRDLLRETGVPYVIENVPGAPLDNPIQLCGSSFGLGANGRQLRRHRLFECSFPVMALPCAHQGRPVGVYGTGGGGQMTRGYKGTPEEYREAMGIDWATRAEIAQAIPPAYTEHIGGYLLAAVQKAAA